MAWPAGQIVNVGLLAPTGQESQATQDEAAAYALAYPAAGTRPAGVPAELDDYGDLPASGKHAGDTRRGVLTDTSAADTVP